MEALEIRKSDHHKILESERPVLLDFYAPWCGPCRSVLPSLDAIAKEYPELLVAKVNVESERELAESYGISSIPTLVVIENGKEIRRMRGGRPKADIIDFALGL